MHAWIWRVKQVWYKVNLMQILSETFMLSVDIQQNQNT